MQLGSFCRRGPSSMNPCKEVCVPSGFAGEGSGSRSWARSAWPRPWGSLVQRAQSRVSYEIRCLSCPSHGSRRGVWCQLIPQQQCVILQTLVSAVSEEPWLCGNCMVSGLPAARHAWRRLSQSSSVLHPSWCMPQGCGEVVFSRRR